MEREVGEEVRGAVEAVGEGVGVGGGWMRGGERRGLSSVVDGEGMVMVGAERVRVTEGGGG